MMLTGGMEAAEGKSQCSPGFTGAGRVGPGMATLASGVGGGGAGNTDTAGGGGGGAFQPAT